MRNKNLYSFLLSFLIIPFSAHLGITFFSLSSDIALFRKEVKANNWNAYRLNMQSGTRHAKKGNYQTALEYFNKAIKNIPNDNNAYYKRGLVYSLLGKSEESIKDYIKSTELTTGVHNKGAYNNIAVEYAKLEDYKNAIKYIKLSIKAYPKEGSFFQNRAMYNMNLKNFKQAVKDYEKAGELFLKFKNSKNNYLDCPKVKKSIHCKMDSWYYNDLAVAKENSGDKKGALENYNKAIEINFPDEEKYIWFNNRGILKHELGDEKGACKDYKFAASIGDEETNKWLNSRDGKWCKKMKL